MVKSANATPAKTPRKKVSATPKKNRTAAASVKKAAPKPEKDITPDISTALSPLNLLKNWFNGWKQTFNLQGRSSRYEFWSFLLLNSIMMVIIQLKCAYTMSERYLMAANAAGYSLETISRHITIAEIVFYLTIFIPLFPIVSLIVRRMHDLGKLAWPNYFEPLFMSVVVLNLLLVALLELDNTDYAYTALCLGVCFVTMIYGAGFYGLKILLMTMFYRGDLKANEFGEPQYNDDEHETQALNLSCLYFLFIITIGLLYLSLALL